MKTIVRDPVCGEQFAWEDATAVLSHKGALHYFCSTRCSKRFLRTPTHFSLSDVSSGVP